MSTPSTPPHRRRTRVLSGLLAVLVTLGLAGTALLWTSPRWLPFVTQQALASAGIELQALHLRRPGWQRMDIPYVEVSLVGPVPWTLQLEDARLQWQWPSLLGDRRLTRLRVGRLTATLHSVAPAAPAAGTRSVTPLPAALLQRLPVDQVTIAALSLTGAATTVLDGILAMGDAQLEHGLLETRLQVSGRGLEVSTAFTMDSAGRLTLTLQPSAAATGQVQLTAQLGNSADGLQAEGQLTMQLRHLPALAPTSNADADTVTATLAATAPFTLQQSADHWTLDLQPRIDAHIETLAGTCDIDGTTTAPLQASLRDGDLDRVELPPGLQLACRSKRGSQLRLLPGLLVWRDRRLQTSASWSVEDAQLDAQGRADITAAWPAAAAWPRLLPPTRLRVDALQWPAAGLALQTLELSLGDRGGIGVEADEVVIAALQTTTERLTLDGTDLDIAPLHLGVDARASLDFQTWQGRWILNADPEPGLTLRGRFERSAIDTGLEITREANAQTTLTVDAGALTLHAPRLQALLQVLVPAWPVQRGEAEFTGTLQWQDGLIAADADAQLSGLELEQGALRAWGGDGRLQLRLREDQRLHWNSDLHLAQGIMARADAAPLVATDLQIEVSGQLLPGAPTPLTEAIDTSISAATLVTPWVSLTPATLQGTATLDAHGWSASGHLRSDALNAGWPAAALDCELAVRGVRIDATACRMETLGGVMRTSNASMDLALATGALDLTLDGLELSGLLALQNDPDLDGAGQLDGLLPLRWQQDRATISGGRVVARGPGRLSYVGGRELRSATTQPGLGLAMQALEDFHFQRLAAGVEYHDDGVLDLAISLSGNNPEVEQSRQINFNLNVSQNLPILLRSLRLSDSLGERIQRRLQEGQH